MAVQICEQIITGRNYDYARALASIQNEEYLTGVGVDPIRRIDQFSSQPTFLEDSYTGTVGELKDLTNRCFT